MATRSSCPSEEEDGDGNGKKHPNSGGSQRKSKKDGRGHSENASPMQDDVFSWPGPKTISLRRTSQGFGFTLRHFIVYPPESAVHTSVKDEENGTKGGRPKGKLEPMDTIFVKQVKEGGPANNAGLCTGDRIVKVNGESIIGKTYSQVIALIQNSDSVLELCVMPKDEDILQLAYSQDAYLKGNDPYTGNAHYIPEPPPVCYPRMTATSSSVGLPMEVSPPELSRGKQQLSRPVRTISTSDRGYRAELQVPPSPTDIPKTNTAVCVCNETVRTIVVPSEKFADLVPSRVNHASPAHRTEEIRYGLTDHNVGKLRPRTTSSLTMPTNTIVQQVTSGRTKDTTTNTSTTNASKPVSYGAYKDDTSSRSIPQTTDTPVITNHYTSPTALAAHQNIDWRNYKTYKEYTENRRLHMYGSRTIQERLDSLRAAVQNTTEYQQTTPTRTTSQVRRRSTSHDRAYQTTPIRCRSVSQERLGEPVLMKDWPRSASQDALTSPVIASQNHRARSCDYLGKQTEAPQDLATDIGTLCKPDADRLQRIYSQATAFSDLDNKLGVHDGFRQPVRQVGQPACHTSIGGTTRPQNIIFSPNVHSTDIIKTRSSIRNSSHSSPVPRLRTVTMDATPVQFCRDNQAVYAGQQPRTSQEKSCLPITFQAALPSSSLSTTVSNGAAAILPPTQTLSIGVVKDQRTVQYKSCGQHSGPRTRAESVPEHSAEVAGDVRSASCSESSPGQPIAHTGRPAVSPATSSIANAPVRQKSKEFEKAKSENKTQENKLKLDEDVWLEQNQQGSVHKDQKASDKKEKVILREKTSLGRLTPQPLRHKSYILAITSPDAVTDPTCWLPNDAGREVNLKRIGQHRKTSVSSPHDDSLASIPFIDEPTSPSVDHESAHIPASAVISAGVSEILTITTVPPSPITPSPHIRRQLSHDQDTIRTSTPDSQPTGKTERSKSYDEGLDNYREERSKSIKHVPSLKGLKKAADSLKLSDDISLRRDSSSDGFSDASKDGWLQFRQLATEKGKRVGGSIRPWKQMYAVLRGHTLYLYKDKKDKTSHASCQFEEEQPISIKACLIDISYSETKRKHVFRLTTSECEYLFQAEDREDMLGWIKAIQENSNLDDQDTGVTSRDLISRKIKEYSTMMSSSGSKTEASPKTPRQSLSIRQTFLGTKNDPKSPHSPKQEFERKLINDTSPPKDKGTWRRGIPSIMRKTFEKKPGPGITFGVRLDDCPPAHNNKFVPLIVEVCCNLVEERGLDYTGIYRVPGNNAAISNLQEELNKATTDIDILDDKWRDLNVISSLLKSFFRKLPEPLFTNDKYADFIDANRKEDSVDRLRTLKKLIRDLPDHHYETLKFLSAHLKTVAENSEKNKMEPRNLAIVFGPTLVRTSEDNMTHMVTHMPDQYKIVETLIQHYDWFFTEEGDEDATTPIQEGSTVDTQPVPNIDHLLTNIGRTGTTPGDVSDSTTSDSAKSKGSRGSGKDQYGRDLLVSSILAAASRKRKKKDIKPLQSSSEDELESGFSRKGLSSHSHSSPMKELAIKREPENDIDSSEPKGTRVNKGSEQQEKQTPGGKRYSSSVILIEKKGIGIPASAEGGKRQPEQIPTPHCPKPTDSPKISYHLSSQLIASTISICPPEVSVSKVNSKTDNMASDTSTMITNDSQVSLQQTNTNKWKPSEIRNLEAGTADVSSITSDYSTISSIAYLTAMDSHTLNAEVRSVTESKGDEADDERSELVSEEHHIETDSDSDFSVFAASYTPEKGACAAKQETAKYNRRSSEGSDMTGTEGSSTPRLDSQRMFSSRKLIECDTLSKRKSIRLKKEIETAVEQNESNKGSKLVDVMKKDKSMSSLASSTKHEPEKVEPPWKLKITDRLKLRLKTSADDMFGIGVNKPSSGDITRKKNIRRRHTLGGHRDFAELSVLNDWRAQEQEQNSQNNTGSASGECQLSAVDRLKPKCQSQDLSITEWLARERLRSSTPELNPGKAPESRPADINSDKGAHPKVRALCGEVASSSQLGRPSSSASPSPVSLSGPGSLSGQVNGDGHQSKSKSNFSSAADAHPHKLSSNQVVKSRFYQYL